MIRSTNKLVQRILSIIFSFFFLSLSASVSLEAQTYGINWSTGSVTAEVDFRDLVWTGSRYVAVGYYGQVYTSADGKSWTKRSTPLSASEHLFGVADDAAGTMVAVGRDQIIVYSEDSGTSWSLAHDAVIGANDIFKVAYGNGRFVAVDEGGGIWISEDGKTGWTKYNSGYSPRVIRFANGFFLMGGTDSSGAIYKSTTGESGSWTKVGTLGVNVRNLHYGNNTWVAVGYRIATAGSSATGWTTRATLSDYCFVDQLYAAGSAPGTFIVAGEHGLMLISADGITWRKVDSGTKRFIHGIAYGSSIVAAVGNGGVRTPAEDYLHSTRWSVSGGTPPDPLEKGCASITVTSPKSGDQWEVGSTHNITWTSQGSVGNVKLEYTKDGGKTWILFDGEALNDGIRAWVVPDAISASCKVKVTDVSNSSISDSSSTFSIVAEGGGSVDGTITVTSPNGGESWQAGSSHDITWTSTGSVGNVRLEYSVNNGSTWTVFDGVALNDGIRNWLVPEEDSVQCRIKITSVDNSSIYDTSNSAFTIYGGTPPTITVTSPNGSEYLTTDTGHTITWTTEGDIERINIDYTTDNGKTWKSVSTNRANTGEKYWVVPDDASNQCRVRVYSTSNSGIVDQSDSMFTISGTWKTPTIKVISPNGGEEWDADSTQTIQWSNTGTLAAVKIEYSVTNGASWKSVVNYTGNDGSFSWTVPQDPSSQCLVRISDQSDLSTASDTSNSTFKITSALPAHLVLNRTTYNFGYAVGGNVPGTQPLALSNAGGNPLNWASETNQTWLMTDPASGLGSIVVDLSIDPSALGLGEYTGTVTVTDPAATNSPQSAAVTLRVIKQSDDKPPFGEMSSPADGIVVSGSVPVTGWVLDDVHVQSVKIYYNEGSYIGDAVFVEGARPDIEEAYPNYPSNYRAGWGYMLLTNSLPDGVYSLYAIALDINGKTTKFGPRTVTIDNANAINPFGAIDTPTQGGDASGSKFVNWGWALTPMPKTIPKNGSTIQLWIDGQYVGTAYQYDIPNTDVAGLFPGLNNSEGPTAFFYVDTTAYENGVHYISWTVTDDAGNAEGIGSRFFTIRNSFGGSSAASRAAARGLVDGEDLSFVPSDMAAPLSIRKGFGKMNDAMTVIPGDRGTIHLESRELERIELNPGDGLKFTTGYMTIGGNIRPLPVGSTLNPDKGTFSWIAGAGFVGDYHLVLIAVDQEGRRTKTDITITIHPR